MSAVHALCSIYVKLQVRDLQWSLLLTQGKVQTPGIHRKMCYSIKVSVLVSQCWFTGQILLYIASKGSVCLCHTWVY